MNAPTNALSAHPDYDRGPQRAIVALVLLIAVFLLLAVVWMTIARLDISAQAIGTVMPSDRVQEIQSLEGGIVESIAVREGQQVRAGDVLATVQNLQFNADLGEARQSLWSARAAIIRLDAELSGAPPVFPQELADAAPDLVRKTEALWASRVRERDSIAETLNNQLAQRQRELTETRARSEAFAAQLRLAQQTLAIEEELDRNRAGARADLIAARQRVAALSGDLNASRSAIRRLEAAVSEARSRLAETHARFEAETMRERNDAELAAATLREQITARADRVSRRTLRAPVDGVVNRLLMTTVGGVAGAGETLMELVPARDKLVIAARVKPSDIAFIRPGQDARVRISAYDASIFGTLDATVLRVGADALLDERSNEQYFEVTLEADHNYVGDAEERLIISPGMMADASIHTGKRTVLEYLLKPIVKTFDKSLRER